MRIGSQYTHGPKYTGGDIGDRRTNFHRCLIVTLARNTHQTGHSLSHQIKTASRRVWSRAAEPRQRAVNQARVKLPDHFVLEPKPLHGAEPKIFDQNIDFLD